MRRIGILCNVDWMNKTDDNHLLINGFRNLGVDAREVSCNIGEDYSEFDAVVVRATWGYQNNPLYYLRCLEKIESETLLLNPFIVIKENINKEKQLNFFIENNIRHLDTIVLNESDLVDAECLIKERFDGSNIVLKPNISASGQDTIMIDYGKEKNFPYEYFKAIFKCGKKVLVQRYAPEISEGEISMVYIGGKYSHSIKRFPEVLRKGRESSIIDVVPSYVKRFGDEVFEKVFSEDILYIRIDLIIVAGNPTIMEIELNEPDLYFRKLGANKFSSVDLFVKETIKKLESSCL